MDALGEPGTYRDARGCDRQKNFRNRRGAAAMATVRFNRGHWVADYYDFKKRRRIERPRGGFENLTDELRAAQALLADRVAEVADGLVHEGYGTFEDAAIRWFNSKVAIRPTTRRSYQQLLSCYLVPYFGARTLRLIQVTDIERFRTELSRSRSAIEPDSDHAPWRGCPNRAGTRRRVDVAAEIEVTDRRLAPIAP
jgi:hypothetical protein